MFRYTAPWQVLCHSLDQDLKVSDDVINLSVVRSVCDQQGAADYNLRNEEEVMFMKSVGEEEETQG